MSRKQDQWFAAQDLRLAATSDGFERWVDFNDDMLCIRAPSDEAFAKIPKDQLNALLADKKKLTEILTYHVVPGKVLSKDVKPGEVKTVEGQSATISTADGPRINNARIIKTDVVASNGVIHVIDTVIMPPQKVSASSSPRTMY